MSEIEQIVAEAFRQGYLSDCQEQRLHDLMQLSIVEEKDLAAVDQLLMALIAGEIPRQADIEP